MLTKKIKSISVLFFLIIAIFLVSNARSKDMSFKIITIEKLSRYNEDRLAFQHIEKKISVKIDNSLSCLLIAKDKKLYLLKDGYDNPKDVRVQKLILDMENRLIPPDLWKNKIDNKPDFIRITDRRVGLVKNVKQEFVTKNFGDFYIKVRNGFIKKHVNIFKSLMRDRKDSGLFVIKKPLPKRLTDYGPTKFFMSATAKTGDDKIYYVEDADGDGITETFTTTIPDGFHWGFESGPNILFIYNNQQEDIKKLIGKLANEAHDGTPEEEEMMKKTFPKDTEIIDMIEDIYRVSGE